MSFERQYATFY